MPSRAEDWLRQALRDLEHARAALRQETFEWAAFAAQQAAEKAVKAVFQSLGGDARGHSVTELLVALPPQAKPATTLIESAKELDPNSYPSGAPMDFYTRGEAERAIRGAEQIIEHCKGHVLR
jgi:HEPN domain-containing protein